MLGRTADAIQDLREALALEESASISSAQTVQSLNHLGTALVFAQDYAEAGEVLAKTVELARRGGLRRIEAAAITMQGQIALNRGQYAQAIELYRQSIEVAGESYLPGMWGKFAGRGAAYLRIGRLQEARTDFERGLEIARRVESRYGQLLMRVYLAFTALAEGRTPADSLAGLEAEAAALDLHAVVLLVSLLRARLWRFLGDFDQPAAAHRVAMQAAQASSVPQFVQNAQLEWLFTQSQSGVIDRDLLEALACQAQASGEVPLQVLAHLTLAATLRAENRRAESLTAAHEALALARSCPDQILTGEALILLLRLHESLGQPQEAQSCRVQLRTLAETAFAPFHLALDTSCDPALRQILIQAVTK
jgi:tetratricopeptide (TPR) repeat protein